MKMSLCGLLCRDCPIYRAGRNGNIKQKIEVARVFSSVKYPIGPEDVRCDGCSVQCETVFAGCRFCNVRKCAIRRKVVNCAYCERYPCKKLNYLLMRIWASGARERLETVRARFSAK